MIININGTQIEVQDGLSQEQIGQFVDEVAPTLGQREPVDNRSFLEQSGDIARAGAEGLTLGFADEISGSVQSILSTDVGTDYFNRLGKNYTRERDLSRNTFEAYKDLYPTEALVGEIAGGVASLILPGAAIGQATRAGRIGNAAVQGGIAGLGGSEAELLSGDTAQDVATGTLLGSAFGSGAELAAAGARGLNSKFGGSDAVFNRLLTTISDSEGGADVSPTIQRAREQLETLENATGQKAALGDLDIFQDLGRETTGVTPVDSNLQSNLQARTRGLQTDILEGRTGEVGVDPTYTANVDAQGNPLLSGSGRPTVASTADGLEQGQIGGVDITTQELVPNTADTGNAADGFIGLDRYATAARQQGNTDSAALYQQAYNDQLNTSQINDLSKLVRNAPALQGVFDTASDNARNIRASQGLFGTPPLVQVIDEAGKVLNSQAARLETGQSKSALTGLKRSLDDIAYQASPSLQDARNVARQGQRAQGNIEAGQSVLDSSVDQVDTLVNSLSLADVDQATLGAGRAVRTKLTDSITTRTKDTKTRRLLKPSEVENYNRLTTQSPDSSGLEGLVSAEAIANRTEKLAAKTPKIIFDELRAEVPGLAKDAGALSAMAAFVMNPNVVMAGLASTRFGQAAVSRFPKTKLAKRTQSELFSLGATKADLDSLIAGDFQTIDPDKVLDIGRGLSSLLSRQTATNVAADKSDSKPVRN